MTTRVLVVEDNRADARLLAEILAEVPGQPFVLTTAESLAAALPLADEADVILLDLSLPDAHGSMTVERMVATARTKPIVVLTGTDDEHAATEALKSGAQDYLLKAEMSASNVARSIKYAIARKRTEAAEVARAKSDEAAARARFVASALREVTRALDLGGALNGLAAALLPRLGDLCILDLLHEDGRIVTAAHAGAALAGHEVLASADDGSPVVQVVRSRTALHFTADDQGLLDDRHRALVSSCGARSFLVSPLLARDRVIGTITTAFCRDAAHGADEQLLAEEVAAHAALAIDNARLYDQTRRAVHVRDELLAIVSHDLRNPMNVMSLALQLIEQGTEAQRSVNLDRVRRALDRMQRLIGDLLDVARVDAGTLDVAPLPGKIVAVLDDALELFKPLAVEKKILLSRDYGIDGDLGSAMIDPERIAQVLSNLLGNALKFTPGGGTIHVGARCISDDKVKIEVRDSGPGIGPEHIDHVFDRFWQKERRSGGVGLGLAIAKGIVEAHGGTIHVESAPGMGASFWFTLQRCQGAGQSALSVEARRAL